MIHAGEHMPTRTVTHINNAVLYTQSAAPLTQHRTLTTLAIRLSEMI